MGINGSGAKKAGGAKKADGPSGGMLKASRSMILGDIASDTAIICLWTVKEAIAKKVDKKEYAIIGQLYSAERGIDLLVRTLLANPQIKRLIITGSDLSKSGAVLHDFFAHGFSAGATKSTQRECWRINSEHEGYIGRDIPADALETLRETITARAVEDVSTLDKKEIPLPKKERKAQVFEKKEEDFRQYSTEESAFVLRSGKTVESWLKILELILKFGTTTKDPDGSSVKELLNVVSAITSENPEELYLPEAFPYSAEHLEKYIATFTTGAEQSTVEYTYGSRIRKYFGVDQVKSVVDKLAKNVHERQGVISLWDPKKDSVSLHPPCLNHIWVRVQDGKLFLTATFRSNDMFVAYPQNAIALRCLQEVIRKDLISQTAEKNIVLGDLVIVSESAHLYENSWESCKDIIEKYYAEYVEQDPSARYDPRGNFIVSVEGGSIHVQFTSPNGEHLRSFSGASALQLRRMIFREGVVSSPEHGYYLGMELMKAELALKLKKPYIQDQPLK